MTKDLVLVTGANGHVGYAVVLEALKKGYNVRAAVRNQAAADKVKHAKASQTHSHQLTFTIVPDITADGAYKEAIKGVDYVIHVASPLPAPSEDYQTSLIKPAVRGTMNILHAATTELQIKVVVITSSSAAVVKFRSQDMFDADSMIPISQGPFGEPFEAYMTSKVSAHHAAQDFIKEHTPHFAVRTVMPTFVLGPHLLTTTTQEIVSGSNAMLLMYLLGMEWPTEIPGCTAHVDDVSFVHVACLDPKIKGNHNFAVNVNGEHGGIDWNDSKDIVKKHFPEEVKHGIFPMTRIADKVPMYFDASKTEEFFNFKFKNFEKQVVDVAGYFAEAAKKEHAASATGKA